MGGMLELKTLAVEIMKITYKKLPLHFGLGLWAKYKGVVATIFEYDTHALIYTIESKNEGQGEVREFIQLLRQDYKEIKSSVPLSSVWELICKKYGIEILEEC